MKRNINLYLQDIQESIEAIEQYTKNLTEQEFLNNIQIEDAVIRRFEIIGEAVKNLDKNFREQYPEVPWKEIAGMRNVFAHEYFGVELDRVWDAVKKDLPELKRHILKMIEGQKSK
jgi:uncharacterized protein with HEPN domain